MVSEQERRRARLLGAATAVLGALALLLAGGCLLALAILLPDVLGEGGGGHFGGLAVVGAMVISSIALPVALVLGLGGGFYVRAGVRARRAGERTPALWRAGLASLGLGGLVAVAALWSDVVGGMHGLAAGTFFLFSAHGVVTIAAGRPGARAGGRRVAALLVAGGLGIALVTSLIMRGGAAELLDGAPLPGLAATLSSYRGIPQALALSPDGARLAVVDGGRITLFDVSADRELWTTHLATHAKRGSGVEPSLVLSPDGSKLLYVHPEGFAVLEVARGEVVLQPRCGSGFERSGAFARGGAVLALSAATVGEGAVCLLDSSSGATTVTIGRSCSSLTADAGGNRVWGLCNIEGGSVPTAFDAVTGLEVLALAAFSHSFALFPDGARVLTIQPWADPPTVRVHDAASGVESKRLPLGRHASDIVGPLGQGDAWLLHGGDVLFEIDVADGRVTRTVCDDVAGAAVAGGRMATMATPRSHSCHPEGETLRVQAVR